MSAATVGLPAGVVMGLGGLPHRDVSRAVRFSLQATRQLPVIPPLPRRSPAENPVAQAVVGVRGVTFGPYGSLAVDPRRLDPVAAVRTDLDHDAFGGFRAFLAQAPSDLTAVTWQFIGPITLGRALLRAGAPTDLAFATAVRVVRSHVRELHAQVRAAFPAAHQVVLLDEPALGEVMSVEFPIPPDTAIDLLSGALAVLEPVATVGVHCCKCADLATLLAAGPAIVSLPATRDVLEYGGYLARFLQRGGWIAWGAVAVDGPIATGSERPWRDLANLWCELMQLGCDPVLLRRQCILTPSCGLGVHSEAVAGRVFGLLQDLSERVHGQAVATRLSIGA